MRKARAMLLLPALAGVVSAQAGQSEGPVGGPLVIGTGVFIFDAGPHDKPACSTVGDDWAVDLTTAGGKAVQALVLTAFALGKTVHVVGKGVCDVWADRETPNYLYIVN